MADFDYKLHHSRAFYAPKDVGNVKKGMLKYCHAKEDETPAIELGYTSPKYVPSDWPKSMWNKTTGTQVRVGKLEWSDEQNAEAVKKLPGYTFDYVAAPEVVADKPRETMDLMAVAAMMADQKLVVKRLEDLEEENEQLKADNEELMDFVRQVKAQKQVAKTTAKEKE